MLQVFKTDLYRNYLNYFLQSLIMLFTPA